MFEMIENNSKNEKWNATKKSLQSADYMKEQHLSNKMFQWVHISC